MGLMTQFTAWCDYLGTEFAIAEVEEHEAERALELAKAQAMILSDPKKGEVTKAKAETRADHLVQEKQDTYDVAYAYRKLMKTLYERAERGGQVASRELTRRVGKEPISRRRDGFRP